MKEPGDGAIIHAVLCGDTQRFEELVRRYEGPLLRVASSQLKDRDSAEDAVQETMLSAFKSLNTYDSRYNFRTWLWTILINQCRLHRRKQMTPDGLQRRTVNELDTAGHHHADQFNDPVQYAINNEQSLRLEAGLSQLPTRMADALRLRFFGGLKFQEIADVMQYSLSTAKNHVRQGLIDLSNRLEADNPTVQETNES